MSEVRERYTQTKRARMSEGSRRRSKRNRTKPLWLIVAVACFRSKNVSAKNEHHLISKVGREIGYWRIDGQYEMEFFGDGETGRRNRALKKSAKSERESSSTKWSKKSSKSSKKSSSSNSSIDLAPNRGEPVASFLELQRHGYRHPTKQHSPKSQSWSKSRRQPTATPSTVTTKPSIHTSSSPTHLIVSSNPTCGSTSSITGSPSEIPSYFLLPSTSPSSEQISSPAPTAHSKSENPSLFATSSDVPSNTPMQSQEPSSNATSTSFPSDPRSSIPSQTTTVAPNKSPSPTSDGKTTLSPSDSSNNQQSLSPSRSLAPSKISAASPPSTLPTILPSSSYFPSEHPIYSSTLNPTNPTQSPSREDTATASPTRFTIKRRLPQFTLEYEIVPFDTPLQNELSELESITSAYLRKQVLAAVSHGDVLLVDFLSNHIFFESEPAVAVVRVTFESIAFFDPLTPVFPTEGEMIELMLDAFTGEEMTGYTGLVQALPSINTFSSSTHILLMETLDVVDAPLMDEEVPVRRKGSVKAFVITAAASILLLSVGTAFWAHGRRQRRRREASEKFINGIIGGHKDTTSSRFSATHATVFGDAHQIMEDDEWARQDIENTEYGTLLQESQNSASQKHDNTGGKCRRNDQRNQPTRTEIEETRGEFFPQTMRLADSFDESMNKGK